MSNEYSQLICKLKNDICAIYGIGYVAQNFYDTLKERGLEGNVTCFITSKKQCDEFNGMPVVEISELENIDKMTILIAVHESNKDSIILNIKKAQGNSYIWIYPLLFQLMLGEPLEENRVVAIKDIVLANRKNLSLALRYAAIEEYYGLRKDGFEIYKKGLGLFSSEKTVEKRLEQFKSLLESWDKWGYDSEHPILLMEDNTYIDGTHRLATAIYHNEKEIIADIYPSKKAITEIHQNGGMILIENVNESGLDQNYINKIIELNDELISKVK